MRRERRAWWLLQRLLRLRWHWLVMTQAGAWLQTWRPAPAASGLLPQQQRQPVQLSVQLVAVLAVMVLLLLLLLRPQSRCLELIEPLAEGPQLLLLLAMVVQIEAPQQLLLPAMVVQTAVPQLLPPLQAMVV